MRFMLTAIAVATLACAPCAGADTFTDRGAFAAATSGVTQIDFANTAEDASGIGAVAHPSPFAYDGLMLTGYQDTGLYSVSPAYYAAAHATTGASYGKDSLLFENDAGGGIVGITFARPVTAFGIDLADAFGRPATFQFASYDNNVITLLGEVTTGSTIGFFGETSTTPIGTILVGLDGARLNPTLNNIRFGNALVAGGAVPEAASWTMMILGLGAVGHALRRGKRVAARKARAA